jgi:hypothetical protein
MQKNGIPGEVIGLTGTGAPIACPVKAIIRRVHHLRSHGAAATTELFWYYDDARVARRIADRYVTNFLKLTASLLGHEFQTTAGALRCTGATALLEGQVPIHLIKLVGRWRSDEVFRYLHTQSPTLMGPLATTMLGAN